MKDIRCILNWHHWQRRKVADSDSYLQCRRLLDRTQSRFDAQGLNLWQEGPR